MSLAVKIAKNQTITLSAATFISLTLTNATLDPQSKKASLFLQSNQDQTDVLVTTLMQDKVESYSCSIKLFIGKKNVAVLKSTDGQVHIIGHYEHQNQQNEKLATEASPIKIQRKSEENSQEKITAPHQKVDIQPSRFRKTKTILTVPQTNKNTEKQVQVQKTEKQQSEGKEESTPSKQQKNSQLNENEKVEDNEKATQKKQRQRNVAIPSKEKGKTSSWLQMLNSSKNNESDSQSDSDGQYEQEQEDEDDDESSSEDDESESEEENPQPIKKKKIKIQQEEEQEEEKEEKKESTLQAPPQLDLLQPPNHFDNSDSSSFSFQAPQKIPSFVNRNQ